jgi:hypothetical protein
MRQNPAFPNVVLNMYAMHVKLDAIHIMLYSVGIFFQALLQILVAAAYKWFPPRPHSRMQF